MKELSYLGSIRKQFEYYKGLGQRTFDQLQDDQLNWQYNDASNSIATIVQHLAGNMKSRWTDFLTTDGEKPWRHRDQEFAIQEWSKKDLLALWESGWEVLFSALDTLTDKDLERMIYIRNMGHTVTEAINRQLAHYSYHVGQIVYIGRMLRNDDWQSLSVPKGQSQQYNERKFSKPKRREHFTDDL